MKMALKWLTRVLLLLIMAVAGLWHFGPYEPVDLQAAFDESVLGSDVDAYFAAREARFSDIRPGHQKRMVWFGERGVKTPQVLVYVHGFSASAQELRPVPDLMADALGANLVYMRLAGHGRSGEAMATATAQAWMTDLAEALAVARQVGDEVILISTSTGGTLVALAALQPELMRQVKGVIFVSPNFAIGDPLAPLLSFTRCEVLVATGSRAYLVVRAAQRSSRTILDNVLPIYGGTSCCGTGQRGLGTRLDAGTVARSILVFRCRYGSEPSCDRHDCRSLGR